MRSGDGKKEDAGVEFRFVDVISRGLFIVLFRIFLFQFRYYEWSDRSYEFLRHVNKCHLAKNEGRDLEEIIGEGGY